MSSNQKIAERLMNNIRLTSDNINMSECYWLCANKKHIDELKNHDHQMVWGRRGTGKTTILKAFNYEINNMNNDTSQIALYVLMASMIPVNSEIKIEKSDSQGITIYVFCNLINAICEQLNQLYECRCNALEEKQETEFIKAYFELLQHLSAAEATLHGGKITIDQTKEKQTEHESKREFVFGINTESSPIFQSGINFLRKHLKKKRIIDIYSIKGQIDFHIETNKIIKWLNIMLESLGITFAYICLDEFSEVDKLMDYSIQSSVAQLIKQVFFKSEKYSVKIASIWNETKLQSIDGKRQEEGLEYGQDIFTGPDLDTMFIIDNSLIKRYFKNLLTNTYYGNETTNDPERQVISNCIEERIFGKDGLRHIICGSQGISRNFVALCQEYLKKYIDQKRNDPIKLGEVYNLIINQYLNNVDAKTPKYDIYKSINKYIDEKHRRYFLIERKDYHRCISTIKLLEARGVYMQIPGLNKLRSIRDNYKIFIINYGNYLDSLQSSCSYQQSRKSLEEDSELKSDGMLFPDIYVELTKNPQEYVVKLPENAETQVYCSGCRQLSYVPIDGNKFVCPLCGKERFRFTDYREKGKKM